MIKCLMEIDEILENLMHLIKFSDLNNERGTKMVKCQKDDFNKQMRLDSNIESKSSNNTYFNIIELLFLIYIFFNLKIIESENLVMPLT